jgi:hypothetical protein
MNFPRLFIAVAVFLLSAPSVLLAQQPSKDWSTIESTKLGTDIIVLTKNGREFEGAKRQSTNDTLFMETRFPVQGMRTISLSRDEIGEVKKKKSRWILSLVGSAIGAGVGLAIGQHYDRPGTDDPGLGKLLFGPMGAGIGFLVGSRIPRSPKTIYSAP